jgi:two-component system osmolarity sensor histidine kinase EnvZ
VTGFKVEGAKEVRQAAQAFLDMKLRIQRQISQRTDMLAAVSHDLRTPLTRMKLQLAMMDPDSADVAGVQSDINDMEKMIEGYLSFVRGEGEEAVTMTDIAEILRTEANAWERQGILVKLDLAMDVLHMPLKPLAMRRCISNILGNAAKYAPHIWVRLSHAPEDDRIDITIEDDGPGIPPDQYEAVFRPFYRVDTSRNTQTGGVGLGLAIAMDIVLAHGGRIWLSPSRHGGLAVHISLPL